MQAMKATELHFHLRPGTLSPEVEFLDGGVLGLNLLPWVEEASHLLVLDAIDASKAPGSLLELSRDEIPLYSGIKVSDHQVTFQEVLGLAKFRGHLPEHLHLIGVQPADISTGVDLSPAAAEAMPKVVARAAVILRKWNLAGKEQMMKKIAFPTDDSETISPHMGRARFFLVATLEDSGETRYEKREKPHHDEGEAHETHEHSGHGMGAAMFSPIADCQTLISGGMGEPAYEFAKAQGLEIILPAEKSIKAATVAYQAGTLTSDLRRIHKR